MQLLNLLSLDEACSFLKISEPTFNKLRSERKISDFQGKRRKVFFNKFELIQKVLAKEPCALEPVQLAFGNPKARIEQIQIDESTFDIRAINIIDPYGALSLLASVRAIALQNKVVNLILDKEIGTMYLHAIGFFKELKKTFNQLVVWDESLVAALDPSFEALFPFKIIGYKGQDKSATEELARVLQTHGFSENIAAYIGWIIGELSDNSLTHSHGPCYLLAERYPGETNFLEIGILDSGVGIQNTLRQNEKYKLLSDRVALLTAFKRFVSSWPDDAQRGKGLTDVVNIARSNKSFFKIDSCDLSLAWDFADLRKDVGFVTPMTQVQGVRFCFVIIDTEFDLQDVEEINQFIDLEIGKYL